MAKFKNHHIKIITDKFIYFVEGKTGATVADDIDDVVHRLQLLWSIGNRRIFYKDRYGSIDEIIVHNGRFSHYLTGEPKIVNKINNMMKRGWI